MRKNLGGFAPNRFLAWLTAGILMLCVSSGAGEQQKKKGDAGESANQQPPLFAGSVSDQIDHDIGEMLGAFQVGEVEAMHKYYADNATFVSGGSFEPPVVGWKNYVALYERQKAAFQGMQLIRRNTVHFYPSGCFLGFLPMAIRRAAETASRSRRRDRPHWYSTRWGITGSSCIITRPRSVLGR